MLLYLRIQNWGKITFLQQILFIFLRLNKSYITISGPSSRQNMKKPCKTLKVFIKKMRHNVLILLCFLNRADEISNFLKTAISFLLLIVALKRRKITVNTHESRNPSNILVRIKSSDEIRKSIIIFRLVFLASWFSPNI